MQIIGAEDHAIATAYSHMRDAHSIYSRVDRERSYREFQPRSATVLQLGKQAVPITGHPSAVLRVRVLRLRSPADTEVSYE